MAALAARSLGRLAANRSFFFLCDMQEKFKPTIKYFPEIAAVAQRLVSAAKILEIPVIATEQYPKGLGNTVAEIDVSGAKVVAKTLFSMVVPEVEEELKKEPNRKSVVLFGIEGELKCVSYHPQTHVCIQQTTLDLLGKGYDVHVVADACSSRTQVDRMFAIERLRSAGAFITTSESALFELMGDSKHPKFRDVQKLVITSAPDSGLLNKL